MQILPLPALQKARTSLSVFSLNQPDLTQSLLLAGLEPEQAFFTHDLCSIIQLTQLVLVCVCRNFKSLMSLEKEIIDLTGTNVVKNGLNKIKKDV